MRRSALSRPPVEKTAGALHVMSCRAHGGGCCMNRSAAVTVVIALVLVSASRAEADAVRITSGFVGVDLVDFQPTLADLSGPGIALTGKIFPTTGLPCLFDCANGSVVDPSGVYTFLAGDLFGFFGHARVGNIMASNADATLKFVA